MTKEDRHLGIILLDGTWRYAAQMCKTLALPDSFPRRSLPPGLVTAYPRRQTECPCPEQGLASIEALYAAYYLLDRDPTGLLDHYYWKNDFLLKNHSFFASHS